MRGSSSSSVRSFRLDLGTKTLRAVETHRSSHAVRAISVVNPARPLTSGTPNAALLAGHGAGGLAHGGSNTLGNLETLCATARLDS